MTKLVDYLQTCIFEVDPATGWWTAPWRHNFTQRERTDAAGFTPYLSQAIESLWDKMTKKMLEYLNAQGQHTSLKQVSPCLQSLTVGTQATSVLGIPETDIARR